MLQNIRDRATGWIAWAIFILISIPFALWGINQYFGTNPDPAVAVVNGNKITLHEFQHAYVQQRERLEQLSGRATSQIDDTRLKHQTLDRMIQDDVLVQASAHDGIRISDAQLASAIRHLPIFEKDGSFSQASYEAWLSRQGLSAATFEFQFRRDLLAQQVSAGIMQTGLATASAVARLARLEQQKRTFDTLTLPASKYQGAKVTDAQVSAYYESHKKDFVTPEEVTLKYLELSRAVIAKKVKVSEAELKSLYQSRKGSFGTPEERRVRHILIKLPPNADKQQVAKARAKLEDIRQRIEKGASFAAMAKKYSQDAGSASKGGDLGFFARGIMDKRFDKVAFSLPKGQISQPVRTRYGLHLIEVEAIRPGQEKSFAQVRDKLRADYQKDHADQTYYGQMEKLSNIVFEHPESLVPAAKALGLQVQESGRIARDGSGAKGVLADPRVLKAAFSTEVLDDGDNSDPVDLGDGRVVVVRMMDHFQPRQRTLKEVHAIVVKRLEAMEAAKAAAAEGKKLVTALRGGADRAALAKGLGLAWKRFAATARDAKAPDKSVLDAVFRMPHPSAGKPVVDGVATPDGNFVVLTLEAVIEPAKQADAARRKRLAQTLALEHGVTDFSSYLAGLRREADVKIVKSVLNRDF